MTTPALMALRNHWPEAHFSILAPAKLADLWAHHPAVDEVISFAPSESPLAIARKLKAARLDTAIIFPNSFKSAAEAWLAGIPERIGYAGQLRSPLLTRALPRPAVQPMRKRTKREIIDRNKAGVSDKPYTLEGHHTRHYLHLVGQVGADSAPASPLLRVTDEEINRFRDKFSLRASMFAGINPGAEYGPAKRWPRERFAEAARQVAQAAECDWLIFGGRADAETAEWIANELRVKTSARAHVLAGKTTLRELCAGLKLCSLLLTNDTGPMHVAAALGVPVVVPFGSTSPELTGPDPLGCGVHRIVKANVPCSPCFLRECPIDFRCMNSISPSAVAGEMLSALNHSR